MGLLDQILGGLAGANAGRQSPMGTGMNTPMGGGMGRGGVNPRVLMALLPIVLNLLANRRRGAGGLGGAGGMGGLGGVLGSVLGGGRSPMGGGMGSGMGGLGGLGAMAGLGGLAGLLGQLSQHGYEQQAQSWISPGPNEPLPPEAVSQLFDQQQLAEIAGEAGVSEDEARMGLSELLPEVVDRFTPQGQLPGEDDLRSSIDDFARQLGG